MSQVDDFLAVAKAEIGTVEGPKDNHWSREVQRSWCLV